MPQISLYIDEETLKKVELQAKVEHMSISKWVAVQIKDKIDPQYPADFASLYGSLASDEITKPVQPAYSMDTTREQLQ